MGVVEPTGAPRILLLGPVRVLSATADVTPSSNKVVHLLALLAAHVNRPVTVDRCVAELWGDAAPKSPVSTLQTYVLNLRGVLQELGEGCRLESRTDSYMLRADDPRALIDLSTFVEPSRDPELAGEALERLALWRGIAFADIRTGESLRLVAHQLVERRRRVLARAYAGALRTARPMTDDAIKILYRSSVGYQTDEQFYVGFAICLAQSPSVDRVWAARLASWADLIIGELEANLGAELGSVTAQIQALLSARQVGEARQVWLRHYDLPEPTP